MCVCVLTSHFIRRLLHGPHGHSVGAVMTPVVWDTLLAVCLSCGTCACVLNFPWNNTKRSTLNISSVAQHHMSCLRIMVRGVCLLSTIFRSKPTTTSKLSQQLHEVLSTHWCVVFVFLWPLFTYIEIKYRKGIYIYIIAYRET